MTTDNARLTVLACAEEALGDGASAFTSDPQWVDQRVSELIQAATAANPSGKDFEREHDAVTAYGESLTAQLSANEGGN